MVSVVNPMAMMGVADSEGLQNVAKQADEKLSRVVEKLAAGA